jgi:hypothetical protein
MNTAILANAGHDTPGHPGLDGREGEVNAHLLLQAFETIGRNRSMARKRMRMIRS